MAEKRGSRPNPTIDRAQPQLDGTSRLPGPVPRAPTAGENVAVIGLEVPHPHVHLVPMNTMDDLNFTRPKLKPSQSELEDAAARINGLMEG